MLLKEVVVDLKILLMDCLNFVDVDHFYVYVDVNWRFFNEEKKYCASTKSVSMNILLVSNKCWQFSAAYEKKNWIIPNQAKIP